MTKLWQKNQSKLHPLIEAYTVGDDNLSDKEIMLYDIKASLAHAKGLEKIGILNPAELEKIAKALNELQSDWQAGLPAQAGKVEITLADEDCHTVIENYLVEKLGDAGKKIHTGRSRNDQVLVALRLYMKDNLQAIKQLAIKAVEDLLSLAEKYQAVPLPGYSHTQQAMLSSVGHYFAALTESLLDDLDFLQAIYQQIDKSPLGSAAGFGVALPLDREFTSQELGFAETQVNSLYCQNSRGKFESIFLEGLAQVMLTLGKFATDMLLFTSREFNFFTVDDSLATGSSIMPQKKNLDVLEIMRGNVSRVISNHHLIQELGKNLPSGYNRDFQLMKKPLLESVKIVKDSLEVMSVFLKMIEPNEKEITAKINRKIFSADIANNLAKEGMPFREAYKQALDKLEGREIDLQENIQSKISLGGPGNLGLELYKKRIENHLSDTVS